MPRTSLQRRRRALSKATEGSGTESAGSSEPAAQSWRPVPLSVPPEPLRRQAGDAAGRRDPLGGAPIPQGTLAELSRGRGRGAALPDGIRDTAQQLLGADLSGVRVHTDSRADALARSVQSVAFSHGPDVYFSSGTYRPHSTAGSRLLAHELSHVAQESGGGHGPGGVIGRADDVAEAHADRMADRIAPALRRSTGRSAAGPMGVRSTDTVPGGTTSSSIAGSGPAQLQRSMLRRSTPAVIRREPGGAAAEVGEAMEEVESRLVDPAETLVEFEELAAVLTDIPKDLAEDAAEEVGDRIAEIEGGADAAGGAEAAEGAEADGGDGHDAMERLEGMEHSLDETKEHLEAAVEGMEATAGAVLLSSDVLKFAKGLDEIFEAAELFKADDSLSKNLGAQRTERAATSMFSGATGAVVHGAAMASQHIPYVGAVHSLKEGVVGAKGAVEDVAAAERLRRQAKKSKHFGDLMLPMDVRKRRLMAFLRDYNARQKTADAREVLGAAKATVTNKYGEFGRFEDAVGMYRWENPGARDPLLEPDPFLVFMEKHGIKEFGKGTEFREEYDKGMKERRGQGAMTADDDRREAARKATKFATFAHRRKAESASVQAVGAVGNIAYGVGDLTAGGDFGATKATGAALKALKAGYVASKKLVKRSRRIHKLRTVKNAVGYGGRADRGVLWGAKVFFGGDVDKQRGHTAAAIQGDGKAGGGHKQANVAAMSDAQRAQLRKTLSLQLERRTEDLIACLKADDERMRHRAKRIVHVLAETNLAGGIQRIDDADLDRFYDLHQQSIALPRSQPAKDLAELEATLTQIVKLQLSGVGG